MENTPKKIEGIAPDTVIDIQVSGGMYARYHQLLMWYSQQKTVEEFTKALHSLKTSKDPSDVFTYHLETILTTIYSIELAAKEQGKLKTVDIPESKG